MDEQIILQVGVKALLKNKDGRFLLLRRNPKKYPEVELQWDIPGGRIDPGATLMENLKREIKEETALNLISEPKLVAAQDILKIAGRHVVRLTYIGEIEGEPQIDAESLEFKWFRADELKHEKDLDGFLRELIEKKIISL